MPVGLIDILASGVTDDSGNIVAGGTVSFYQAGTSTLETVYQDFELTTAHANPATLSASGRLIAYSDTRVKLVIRDSNGVTVRTIDDVNLADSDVETSLSAGTLAGDGLVANGSAIDFNPDGSTLTTSSDQAKVKDAGITPVQLAQMSMGPDMLTNYSISCTVGSNALTIALKTNSGSDPSSTDYCTFAFRSTTATTGTYSRVDVTAATSLVISAGSTLGHVSAAEWPIYVYAINNAGTVVLGASSSPFDERYVASTTAEGGAGAADSAAVMYSTAAQTSKAIRLLAVLKSTQATAGTWAAVPTNVSNPTKPHPLSGLVSRPSGATVGVGGVAVSGNFAAVTLSGSYQDLTNASVTITTTGRPVKIEFIAESSAGAERINLQSTAASWTVAEMTVKILRDSTTVKISSLQHKDTGASSATQTIEPWSQFNTSDLPPAGTYTYKVQVLTNFGSSLSQADGRLMVYEI